MGDDHPSSSAFPYRSRRHDDEDRSQHTSSRNHRHHSSSSKHRRSPSPHHRSSHRQSSSSSSSKRRRDDNRDDDRGSSRPHGHRHRDRDDDRSHRGHSRRSVSPPAADASTTVPSSSALNLQSHAEPTHSGSPVSLPKSSATETQIKRDNWMVAGATQSYNSRVDAQGDATTSSTEPGDGEGDYFSSLGNERVKKPKEDKPNPDELRVSSRELNTQFAQGKHIDEYADQAKQKTSFGAPGYQWRLMKLRKTFEQASEEGRSIEDVAMERYGDMASFEEAKAEKAYLDGQGGVSRGQRGGTPVRPPAATNPSNRSFMFTDSPNSSFGAGAPHSRPVSRQSFRKPGEASAPSTPQPEVPTSLSGVGRLGSLRGTSGTPQQSKSSTPIPTVFTPTIPARTANADANESATELSGTPTPSPAVQSAVAAAQARDSVSNPPLDAAALNKLEAKVMKAEMMGKPNARSLRDTLEKEKVRATSGGDQGGGHFEQTASVQSVGSSADTNVQVLPTLDGRGRLYDVGRGRPGEDEELPPGNRRRKANKVQTHDPKTGEFVRYNVDDDEITLEDMVRQEKFKAGSGDQKNYDAELGNRIASDGAFKEGFDYLDENVERLARKKMRSDALKRQFAINDFAKTKKALESCRFCFQDEGEKPPLARLVASGTRAYLALPDNEPLVEGHCFIVPIQHHLSMLDADDDTWEEVKNFMKCLLQLADSKGQGVVFYETVVSLKQQRHTVIEALPLEKDLLSSLPGNFRQELMNVESDWSQHHKVISFTPDRPFRRAMVPQLPYFMIQFDHKGEKGYGHVIEGAEAGEAFEQQDEYAMSEAAMGGGKFDRWFAAEVIGSLLDLEPRAWRKPRRLDHRAGSELLARFEKEWEPFNWTKMLGRGGGAAS
ncbi:hypothetical protein BCV69DRAFT_312843 [Microstroma glucosiphilum]|uniref:CwfJ C-terminus 1-domain-containing protein-like protein n=1 Tax=Pseudomicrostroma glucosiphilum TaxID=1684307 RepID=A0A316U4R8_9BASI|nr:hypothetical protein BCV69DRAFT_312843 [Pseudomicrostroma glucosiphilum]PWN20237.1 hypothetical protein BCV69DRAFT_312843 [Pseudomicrostroma glucosiphilum]